MRAITLEVEDDFFQKFFNLLDALPEGKVRIKSDPLKEELENRIKLIDDNKATLTPYNEGIGEILDKLESKYANS